MVPQMTEQIGFVVVKFFSKILNMSVSEEGEHCAT